MERSGFECGDTVVGRSDKKFCCDTCRNTFNNARNRDSINLIRNTHNRLRKNYRILGDLNPNGKTEVSLATLLNQGFSFEYITGISPSEEGGFYRHVYDQAYLPLENGLYLLVKKIFGEK